MRKKASPLFVTFKLFKYASVGTEYQVVGEKNPPGNVKYSHNEC